MAKLSEVFGVSNKEILSYVERPEVDEVFLRALADQKHIVIYGASKQGKSSLMGRHLKDSEKITVHCGTNSDTEVLYRSFLRQIGVEIQTNSETAKKTGATGTLRTKVSAFLPFLKSDVEAEGGASHSREQTITRSSIEVDLGVAQDVGELILKTKSSSKLFVIENFHYLSEDVQKRLAFDLRTFEEMQIRFAILGVWKEKNRLSQFNGDLLGRVLEVPVDPWSDKDFYRVISEGSKHLNISIDTTIQNQIVSTSFGSVGVVQELTKLAVSRHGIQDTQRSLVNLTQESALRSAEQDCLREYQSRHQRSLESIASSFRQRRPSDEYNAFYLNYYIVQAILSAPLSQLLDGIERKWIEDEVKKNHSKKARSIDNNITRALKKISRLQQEKSISPPIFDYDTVDKRLRIIDSTFFFFFKHADINSIKAEIPNPEDTEQDEFTELSGPPTERE